MATRISLASEESARALEVLQRELVALRPSRRQVRLYRLLNWVVSAFGVSFVLLVALYAFGHDESSPIIEVTSIVAGIAVLLMVALFILNLGLVWKLWRVARTRRRLGLAKPLAAAFKAQRRKGRFRNLLTGLLVFLGAVLLVSMIPVVAALEGPVLAAVLYPAICLPLMSLHFIRRGVERRTVVERLHAKLSAAASDARVHVENSVALSPDDYELIARIERAQIVAQRQESIEHSGRGAEAAGFAVHVGVSAHQAKSGLAPPERLLVDECIIQLMDDPEPSGVVVDPRDALHRLAVPNTAVEIDYYVDREGRRIKIARIVSPSGSPTADPAAGG